MTSPSSAPSMPLLPCTLFLFLSATSTEDVRVATGVGGQGTIAMAREEPPEWAISRASKFGSSLQNPSLSECWSPLAVTKLGRA